MQTAVANRDDIKAIARIHQQALPLDLLGQLGRGFLYHLYLGFIDNSDGFLLCTKKDNQVLGFVSAAFSTKSLYHKILRQQWLWLGWYALWHLIQKPSNLSRLLGAFLYPAKQNEVDMPELISIAVDPLQQHRGVGQQLIAAFDQRMCQHGSNTYYLIVGVENQQAFNFYQKHGFIEKKQLSLMSRRFRRLEKVIQG